MSRHLSSREFVEAADGALGPRRRRHLSACARCQERLREFEASLEAVESSGEIPEPSPVFWDRFAERVRLATNAEWPPARRSHVWTWRALAVSMPAFVMLVLVLGYDRQVRVTIGELPTLTVPRVDLSPAGAKPPVALETPVWDDMAALAGDVPAETWPLVSPTGGGTAEALVEALTAEERSELVRLLREAIGGGA